ncbi:SDR family NAD(P)-dependent oxidoreductase [Arthrobacter sp. MMS18-M83]|uniref:SDR family NAD(P)-dependent oxidoreductase n=1 Tax=Arthrobacter sp. MMS18-M83 TaxID=2996261 RepID=UPI00227B5C6E|nr:SDR family oxidoreductase [Arthrobacter sp. MMS18-M83]WAH97560.1 SDR family NAD(P)-dependent oxidoreductase [Arthrobacter sp. MMS18-M83]
MMMAPHPALEGTVALVTGAAQGIGLSIAAGLRAQGARVALIDIQDELLADAVASLGGESQDVRPYAVDLGDLKQAAALPDRVAADFGSLDIVVNNAGRRGVHSFEDYPLDDWQRTLDLNLTAPFLIAQGAVRTMLSSGRGGSIVNVTSVAADLAFKNRSAYNASKAGLVMLTKSIAVELGGRGIRCNGVAPGIVETPINAEYLRTGPESAAIIAGTPTGSWGQPEDVAAAVVFLCTPAARFINGTIINADGGWTAGKGY